MSRAKDPIEMELGRIVKTARTSIRLKHSLAADEEINEELPKIETAYYAAVQRGQKFQLEAFTL